MAAWNVFIEREASTKKLEQRAHNKMNMSKKKDVHVLGSNSYSQVAVEWKVCNDSELFVVLMIHFFYY